MIIFPPHACTTTKSHLQAFSSSGEFSIAAALSSTRLNSKFDLFWRQQNICLTIWFRILTLKRQGYGLMFLIVNRRSFNFTSTIFIIPPPFCFFFHFIFLYCSCYSHIFLYLSYFSFLFSYLILLLWVFIWLLQWILLLLFFFCYMKKVGYISYSYYLCF